MNSPLSATISPGNSMPVPRNGTPLPHPADRRASSHRPAGGQSSPADGLHGQGVRSWPLLVLALPAAVAVWSGWVGIGQLTGFGEVHPLPGIWDSLHLDTAVTLPVGVEAYAAYALRAWLTTSPSISPRTRRYARWSAIASLMLGMAGQVTYHLLAQAHAAHAPWAITTAVSCLPVLVLGMGAALAHLLRADTHQPGPHQQGLSPILREGRHDSTHAPAAGQPATDHRLAHAEAIAGQLFAAGQRISRRNLRAAGLRGSNAALGTLARAVSSARDEPEVVDIRH